MEAYRRGHNGPDSKSGKPLAGSVGSNPTASAKLRLMKVKRSLFYPSAIVPSPVIIACSDKILELKSKRTMG